MCKHQYAIKPRKPIIKWVGGKRGVINHLIKHMPKQISKNYIEPFVGGGALYFHLAEGLKNANIQAVLSDQNSVLMDFYLALKVDPEGFFKELNKYKDKNNLEDYMRIRSLDRNANYTPELLEVAARFYYLNKTAFQGLWRTNKKGQHNVPYGKYKNFNIPSLKEIQDISIFLRKALILNDDFYSSIDFVGKDTFVYLDPPYTPVSASSNFVSYCQDSFN